MGGDGSKTSGQQSTSDMSQAAFFAGMPAFQAAMDMFTNTVNTGMGPESRQPIYSQAAEKSLQASSQAQAKLGEDMARIGLTGTPFEERAMREIDQEGRLNARNIPMQMENQDYWKILSTFFPGAGGAIGQGIQGNTAIAAGEAEKFKAMAGLIGSMFSTGMGGVQGAAKG